MQKTNTTPSYALLEAFSADCGEHNQAYPAYSEPEIFSATDAVCYKKMIVPASI